MIEYKSVDLVKYYKKYPKKPRPNPTGSELTAEQWQQIKDKFNNECAYCGISEESHLAQCNEVLHQDHFIPLSKGGEWTHNNIIPACRSCNSSKGNKNFFEWYPKRKYYNKNREIKILKHLKYYTDGNIQQLTIFK